MIAGSLEIQLRADIARLQRDMDDARRVVGGAMGNISQAATAARRALAGLAAGFSLAALGHQVVEAQREFDKLNASLVTATGSTANAAQAFKALQAFAATTPYSVAEATEAFIKMRNLGLDPSERALRAYGNTAAAMGKGLNQMIEAVADASTGEFERLKEFGITAKQNGDRVSLTFKGMSTTIGNNAKEIQEYLRKLGEVDFAGGMEVRAATLDGAISNLGDTWAGTMRTIASNGIGQGVMSGVMALSSALQDLSAILDVVGGAATKEGKAVSEAGTLHKILTAVFETVAVLGVNVAYVFEQIGNELAGLAAQATLVLQGDFKAASALGDIMKKDAADARKAVDAKSEAILGAAKAAQDAQAAEAEEMKKTGTDRLAQYAIVLTAEQKQQKALADTLDIRNRLNGVNAATAGELAKLKTALETGAISQADYNRYVAQVNKEAAQNTTVYKNSIKQIDLQTESLKRQSAARAYDTQQVKLQLEFMQRTGQVDEESFINKGADADLKLLQDQRTALEGQLKLQRGKIDNQKELKDLQAQIDQAGKDIAARELKQGNDLFELDQKRYREAVGNSADVIEVEQAELISLRQQTQAQIDQNEQIGLTTKQLAALTTQRLEESAARKDAEAITAEGLDLTGERAQRIRDEAKAIRERAAALGVGAAKQDMFEKPLQDAAALVDIMSALDEAAQSAAQGMAKSFGSVGEAIGGMTTALSGYQRTEAAIAAQRLSSIKDAGGDRTKIERANTMAAQASAQAQIKSYGDMAGAAKGFFKENTTGYRVMEGVEKTFRAFEMAMALKNMAEKLGLLTTYTTAAVVGKQVETQATLASVAPEVAAAQAKGMANAAAGVAGQAQGDPYTAWPRMAAMAAVMVGLGFAVSGGMGGVDVAKQRQEAQGTGSVLGDSSAKSESIKRAIDLTASNTSTQIDYLKGMLTSLRTIESNIGNFASQLVQTTDFTGKGVALNTNNGLASTTFGVAAGAAIGSIFGPVGTAVGAVVGLMARAVPVIGKIATAIFGGKQTVQDQGITMSPTQLAQVMNGGANALSYTDIKTSGGLFSHSHTDSPTASLGAEANRQITSVITSMADSITIAAQLMGASGDDFTRRLGSFVIDLGKVSLKDLKGDELQTALESVFSKLGDDMAKYAISGLEQFQKVGEGYLETLVRVASDYAKVDASLTSIGTTFGATGLASIAARESLIELMGGIDELQSKTADFAENFLTEAQRLAPVQKYVSDELAKLNLGWVDTREEFAQVILGLDKTTAAGQAMFATLMGLESAFAATHEAIKDTSKSAQDIADERKDLQDQLDQLTMTSAELLAKQRDALDASNRSLFDQVQAAQKVKDAQDAAKSSLGDFITRMKSFATTTAGLNNSLALGSLSTLTPEQQYAEARRQFESTRQLAAAGDATAQGQLQAIEQTFLQLSQKLNGGDAQYSSDLATVMRTNEELSTWAASSVDVAQASLDALNGQSASLTDISGILASIAQGVQYLPAALSGQDVPAFTQAFTPIDYSRMGTVDMAPLVAEIKGLREEVKGRRADAKQQTGDLIQAGDSSAQRAAETVVDGVSDAITDGAYASANSERKLK
jgi:hypothetical protein